MFFVNYPIEYTLGPDESELANYKWLKEVRRCIVT